jgi:hypothetical protein
LGPSEDRADELAGVARVERLAGHQAAVEDGAQERDGREFGVEVGAEVALADTARDEVDQRLPSVGRRSTRSP